MRLLDINTVDAVQITKPEMYATHFGNTMSALTSISSRILEGEERKTVLKKCVEIILDIQEWFVSKGVICWDDIITATYHSTLVLDILDNVELERMTKKIIVLNRIVIQDSSKYDYEVAMMASSLIEILSFVWKRLDNERYLKLSRENYDTAYNAWIKYGFREKAENFKKKYGVVWQ